MQDLDIQLELFEVEYVPGYQVGVAVEPMQDELLRVYLRSTMLAQIVLVLSGIMAVERAKPLTKEHGGLRYPELEFGDDQVNGTYRSLCTLHNLVADWVGDTLPPEMGEPLVAYGLPWSYLVEGSYLMRLDTLRAGAESWGQAVVGSGVDREVKAIVEATLRLVEEGEYGSTESNG